MFKIARVGIHNFEEPCLSGTKGSGTVFFSGCNLGCLFCQNYEISKQNKGISVDDETLFLLIKHLEDLGAHNINFVSPTIWAKRLIPFLQKYKSQINVPIVWNSSGYERVEYIASLAGLVDIFLPDFKYSDDATALEFSKIDNYVSTAIETISQMRQLQPIDKFDQDGIMQKGVIVRHLVLPECMDNTIGVLKELAKIDKTMFVSLMCQYFPTPAVFDHAILSKRVSETEYQMAVDAFFEFGLSNGFSQEPDSATDEYVPDFDLSLLQKLIEKLKN